MPPNRFMDILLDSPRFLLSALLAAIMGFAIQRGATCMVAAVDEVVTRRRFARLAAMLSASLWVLAGLLLAQWRGVLPRMPVGYAITGWTVLGGALLGFGAFLGRACVFGAIARFGNGEWSYLLVPVGFLAGCVSVDALFMPMMPSALLQGSSVLGAAPWVAGVLIVLVVAGAFAAPRDPGDAGADRAARDAAHGAQRDAAAPMAPTGMHGLGFAARVWSPGAATAVIGVTFFFMMLLVGPWAYTDALADVARRMPHDLAARGLLMLALFTGALTGGLTARRFARTRVTPGRLARCFASGVLMGWGSLLIPGGNDGLILVGMPLLFGYAWVAMTSMALTIAGAMLARRA